MNKRNYQLELEKVIDSECVNKRPSLLLHSCCAPCSSYVLEYIAKYFEITLFYYNPNISLKEEFDKRVKELYKLLELDGLKDDVKIIVPEYDNNEFYDMAKGLENEPERGKRCYECYKLRLEKSAVYTKENGFDFFTTTLSISPHKNADWINEIGEELADKYGVRFLNSDFKKKGGYQRSIELSKEYDLYRQDYCGCVFSKNI